MSTLRFAFALAGLLCVSLVRSHVKTTTHYAHLPPTWYVQQEDHLRSTLATQLRYAAHNFSVPTLPSNLRALIVPHASLHYSGICAASAYQSLLDRGAGKHAKNTQVKRVIVLAPSHKIALNGVAVPTFKNYRTVLGDVLIDRGGIASLTSLACVEERDDLFSVEHSLEIQLPYLQHVLASFQLLPLMVGKLDDVQMRHLVTRLRELIDDETIVVVSSDFVHHGDAFEYTPFSSDIVTKVKWVDSAALQVIEHHSRAGFDELIEKTGATICGRAPLRLFLSMLEDGVFGDVVSRLACYYTSAHLGRVIQTSFRDVYRFFGRVDDAMAKRSVSYLSVIFERRKPASEVKLTGYEQKALIALARDAVENALAGDDNKVPEHLLWPLRSRMLSAHMGAFVTHATLEGKLRGCIGRTVAHAPLYETVASMAQEAAFNDNRFEPIRRNEFPQGIISSISVLTEPQPVDSYNQIDIDRHGIILQKVLDGMTYRSVFLPHVASGFGWDRDTTLEQLSTKAGLEKDAWRSETQFFVFEALKIDQ